MMHGYGRFYLTYIVTSTLKDKQTEENKNAHWITYYMF